jgi:hypothetical protein
MKVRHLDRNSRHQSKMQVLLTRKLAERIDGVDLSGWEVGQALEVPLREAQLLVAEGWAEPTSPPTADSPAGRTAGDVPPNERKDS